MCTAQENIKTGLVNTDHQSPEVTKAVPEDVPNVVPDIEATPERNDSEAKIENMLANANSSIADESNEMNKLQEMLEKAKRENAIRANMRKANLTETECLAMAMYHEARGEGERGLKAVAFVINNRKQSGKFPSTICDVVRQKAQFSFISDKHSDSIKEWDTYSKVLAIAIDLLDNGGFQRTKSPVGNALFFNSFKSKAAWVYSRASRFISTIGNHHFFK